MSSGSSLPLTTNPRIKKQNTKDSPIPFNLKNEHQTCIVLNLPNVGTAKGAFRPLECKNQPSFDKNWSETWTSSSCIWVHKPRALSTLSAWPEANTVNFNWTGIDVTKFNVNEPVNKGQLHKIGGIWFY